MAEMLESDAQGEEYPSAWARLGRRRWAICAMLSIAASGSLLVLFLVFLIAPGLKKVELAA
jgi:hypothetical protein